ncbi:MAG: response regulator [Epsilonproteobacteria bacterium]|nr:response regulator [Campylobacterota bacterium]
MQNKYKLLIIEDSRTFNNMLKRALDDIATQIVQTFTFEEAEEALKSDTFDFILLDLVLPDGEGEELLEMLPRKLRQKTIVLSGDEEAERRSHVFELGILDYFSKLNPFHMIINEIKSLIASLEGNRQINILAIDDSSFMRRKIQNILAPRQYNLTFAKSAEEGLEYLKQQQFYLILLDIELPGMSGVDFLELIKKYKKFFYIPVIAISGNDAPHIVARLLKQGANDFIKKPFITEYFLLKCNLQIKNYQNIKLIKQQAIELKKAEEVKSRFLANMSHEIRTPLNAILGFITLLRDKQLDQESKKYLEIIHSSSKSLLNILNDILDFSKIESGKLTIEHIDFSPMAELMSVVELFTLKAQEKNIKIISKIQNLPPCANSDPVRIKQVIMNLLSNAIKFTPEGKNIYVDISYDDGMLHVSIQDEGIGLTVQQQQKIFNPFTQADDSITRKYGGTGLGLTISYQIVKLLGGELKVESEVNKGSRFYFDIPLEAKDKQVPTQTLSLQKSFSDAKVLIVEDNKANQMFLEVILKKLGLEYDVAENGKEAVERVKEEDYDVILMDENMPVMNGIEATKQIRQIQTRHIPIIAVTANALSGDRQRFLDAGLDEYIPKPVEIDRLKHVLSKFLKDDNAQ